MFPYVMIICSFIFFSSAFQYKLLNHLLSKSRQISGKNNYVLSAYWNSVAMILSGTYFCIQLIIPLRFLAYPGELFWYEEGYRFSWLVMLMEEAGNTFF